MKLPLHWLPLLLLAAAPACAQRLTTGGPTVPVNWLPAGNATSLALDLDGDGQPDVAFSYSSTTSAPAGPTQSTFAVSGVAGSALELALDAAEYDSAHRYLAGDLLDGPVLWQHGSGYLDYVLTGNGGVGGRGFFRNHAAGFVVLRKVLAGTVQYWWLYIGPRSQATDAWVQYYSSSPATLATAPASAAAEAVFPNPAASAWQLAQPATYHLFDAQGRLVGSSVGPATTVPAASLAPGCYLLLLHCTDGTVARQLLQKQ